MAKYVCDFDQVTAAGEALCSLAEEMESAVGNYNSKINDDLSGWSGKSKSSFTKSNSKQVKAAKTEASNVKSLGEFVKGVSSSISSLEGELSGLSI